jgi:hypothetical protein
VSVFTIGLPGRDGALAHEALSEIAAESGGAALWSPDADQLPVTLGGLRSLRDGSRSIIEAEFRVTSPVENAFSSGRTLLGTVSLEICRFDCYYVDIPVVVTIP